MKPVVLLAVALVLVIGGCQSGAVSGTSLSITVLIKTDQPGQLGHVAAYFAPVGQTKRSIGQVDSVGTGPRDGVYALHVTVNQSDIPTMSFVQLCTNGLMFQPRTSGGPYLTDGATVTEDDTLLVVGSC